MYTIGKFLVICTALESLLIIVVHLNFVGQFKMAIFNFTDVGLLKRCIEDRKRVHRLDIQRSIAQEVNFV